MRTVVQVVVELDGEQEEKYAREYDLPRNGPGGRVLAKDYVASLRENVLYQLEHSTLTEFASVSIKER